ncbi:MAG: hypothetical protein IRZ16_08950 [Myxococcaceae bacterium]|nr:hypothetical protein [Myxococcaceae bacterium]
MSFRFEYRLGEAGWALATIALGGRKTSLAVSYLHDSLRDLASSVRALCEGAPAVTVVFMDEPGEAHLRLRRLNDDRVGIEVIWYSDWKSRGMNPSVKERRLKGSTTLAKVRSQVIAALRAVLTEHGEAGYLERWIAHPFPTEELRALETLQPKPPPQQH